MFFLGVNKKYSKRVHLTDNRDCLSPSIEKFFSSPTIPKDIMEQAKKLEGEGWEVCVDIEGLPFYETEVR